MLSPAVVTAAQWDDVTYHFAAGEENRVKGPGEGYASVRPTTGPWTAEFGASNHFANLTGETIRVYSARRVAFHDYNMASGNAGQSGHIVFQVRLSEPIAAAVWKIGGHGKNVAPPGRLTARYSRDGRAWFDVHQYPAGLRGDYAPPQATLRFDPPTDALYIGWFADVPAGTGWWLVGGTGHLTFTPARSNATAPPAGTAKTAETARADDLHGPRVVPDTFFGTTTHVNSEGLIRLLADLGIGSVRVDFPWEGIEPSRGQYNLDPKLWMHASAELGIKHSLDQLVVLTRPPTWGVGPRGTFPSEPSEAAFEEFMFRLASKYKGKIRHWQAGNEPNMAVWRERFIPFLKAYYRGVKRADPQNKVVLCGFAGVEHLHLDAVYRLGGKDYFDILGAHPYTRPAMPEDGGYLYRIRAIREVMLRHGDRKPLWVDEVGWNGVEPAMLDYLKHKYDGHRNYAVTEEEQARGLSRVYLLSAAVPWIERVYFFHLHQEAAYTEAQENVDYYMGLFTPWLEGQIRPKDAYFAVRTVIRVLRQSTYKGRIETPPRVWCLHFERGNEATFALWSQDDGLSMTLSDSSAVQSAISMVGSPVLVKNTLPIGGRPLYLTTRAADAERLKQQIRNAGWRR